MPFFIGCEKAIDFDLDEQERKLVVEATIENGQPPLVYLSKSLAYFSKIDPQVLNNSLVRGAEVYISNGVKTHKLKEYAQPITNNFNLYYYSIDSNNLQTAFLGEEGKKYSLEINYGGEKYTASTTIPLIDKKIDSIWWKPVPFEEDTTKVLLMVRATDPPGYGHYIRYWTKRNSESFLPGFNSVFDDQVIDGTTYDIQVAPGIDRNDTLDFEENFFRRGDTVTLKFSLIDKATYDFWRTMEFSYQSIGNPFSSPTKILSNISNNALGYFGGYASQYYSLIIPQ